MAAETIAAIGDIVEAGVDQVSGLVRQAHLDQAEDPCMAEIVTRSAYGRDIRPKFNKAIRAANRRADAGPRAVQLAINRLGRSSGRYRGGVPFAQWVRENLVNESDAVGIASIFGGHIGLALATAGVDEWVDNRLPAGRPQASMAGLELGSGISIYRGSPGTRAQQLRYGKLRGPAMADAYDSWAAHERGTVYPPAYPTWRQDLVALTGRQDWTPGDPVEAGSILGRAAEYEAMALEAADRSAVACAANRESRRAAELVAAEGWLVQQRSDAAANILRAAGPIAAIVVGAFVLPEVL